MKHRYRNYSNDYENNKVDLDDGNERAATKEADGDNRSEKIIEKLHKLTAINATVTVLSNLRESPSLDSNVLLVLQPGTKVQIFENPGDFYKVEYDDYTGYIKKDLVKR